MHSTNTPTISEQHIMQNMSCMLQDSTWGSSWSRGAAAIDQEAPPLFNRLPQPSSPLPYYVLSNMLRRVFLPDILAFYDKQSRTPKSKKMHDVGAHTREISYAHVHQQRALFPPVSILNYLTVKMWGYIGHQTESDANSVCTQWPGWHY